MLKTNSKKAIEGIRAYIINHYQPDGYEFEETSDFGCIARNIMLCFYHEKVTNDRRRMAYQDLFIEWMDGMPTIINAEYIWPTPVADIIGPILEETEAERSKYTEREAELLMSKLIYRELTKMVSVWDLKIA